MMDESLSKLNESTSCLMKTAATSTADELPVNAATDSPTECPTSSAAPSLDQPAPEQPVPESPEQPTTASIACPTDPVHEPQPAPEPEPTPVPEPRPMSIPATHTGVRSSVPPAPACPKRLRILDMNQDVRQVTFRDRKRDPAGNTYRSKTTSPIGQSGQLFVEPEALRQILPFVGWGRLTPENKKEQAALMYGRLCEAPSFMGKTVRWGEVCGIIPVNSESSSSVSIEITAHEWARMDAELDKLNAEAEQNGTEQFVSIGWLHTHPFDLNPYFSHLDMSLQKRIMSNDNLFGLVINPHRRIFGCYKDEDSKPCNACFVLDDNLTHAWAFSEERNFSQNLSNDSAPVLTMKPRRPQPQAAPAYQTPIIQAEAAGAWTLHLHPCDADSQPYNAQIYPNTTKCATIREENVRPILLSLKQIPNDPVAVVTLRNSADHAYSLAVRAIMDRTLFNRSLRSRMLDWSNQTYAMMLYTGSDNHLLYFMSRQSRDIRADLNRPKYVVPVIAVIEARHEIHILYHTPANQ